MSSNTTAIPATTRTQTITSVATKLRELGGKRTALHERIHAEQLEIATLKGLDNGEPATDAFRKRDIAIHNVSKASNEALVYWREARAHLHTPIDLPAAVLATQRVESLLGHIEQQIDAVTTGNMESHSLAQPANEAPEVPDVSDKSNQTSALPQMKNQPQPTQSKETPAVQPASAVPAPMDISGLEARLGAVVEAGLKAGFSALQSQTAASGLSPEWAELLREFSPEDLRPTLKGGRWWNSKRVPKKDKEDRTLVPLDALSHDDANRADSTEAAPNK